MVTFLDVLERTQTGPICKPRDWDIKIVPTNVSEVLKGRDIKCDPDNPVCMDDDLADKVYEAGFELALRLGVLCLDTQRIIKISEEELKEAINEAASTATYGRGLDAVTIRNRKPEERRAPLVSSGPFGTVVSEELWLPIHQSFAQYKTIDRMSQGTLKTVYSRELRSGTPFEFLGGILEIKLTKEAIRRAGRPGMPTGGVQTDITGLGFMGGWTFGGLTNTDYPAVSMASELKTTYYLLTNVAYIHEAQAQLQAYHHPIIGGYAGGSEGTAVMRVASILLLLAAYKPTKAGATCMDSRYLGNCGRQALWANSVSSQALSRNTHVLFGTNDNPVSGSGTDTLLYEAAACAIASVASGDTTITGPRVAQVPDHTSGLEGKFFGEVIRASITLKRSDANCMVKQLIPKYENRLSQPPAGKPFTELFDVKTLKPAKEWLDSYLRVKRELKDLGLPEHPYSST
ncbi:MAG TPA: monomethylamine:corrinoid methyltransferase [Candidatus Bathyarchaeia archaeon]|nr:monomethylamine:corrinoid methyltransferase [Candidatus Bathyarchaeia archaeon]